MSQSDYIKYKRVSTQLANNKFPPIFDPENYVDYKEYSLENTIFNTRYRYNQLIPPNKTIVFDMEKSVSNTCAQNFAVCKNTNLRSNKIPLLRSQITPKPLRPLTNEQLGKSIQKLDICLCTNY